MYIAYNETKHDLHANFAMANLDMRDAVCGLLALLSRSFVTTIQSTFPWAEPEAALFGPRLDHIYRAVSDDWPDDERYNFSAKDWQNMKAQPDRFSNFTIPKVIYLRSQNHSARKLKLLKPSTSLRRTASFGIARHSALQARSRASSIVRLLGFDGSLISSSSQGVLWRNPSRSVQFLLAIKLPALPETRSPAS